MPNKQNNWAEVGYRNVFCRSLDSLTIYTLVVPTKQNNWAEVGYRNVFCRSLDSLTIYTLVMPNKQNNWAELGYKNRFCNDSACKNSMHHYLNKNDNANIFISRNHIYFLVS
jgi:hypothetical protein